MLFLAAGVAVRSAARAELQIDITKGVTDPIPIAIVPFATAVAGSGAYDFAAVVQHDLDGSGRFKTLARTALRLRPSRAADVVAADWHADGVDYVVVGRSQRSRRRHGSTSTASWSTR